MKKWLAAGLAVIFLLFSGCTPRGNETPRFRVVASFYPLYVSLLNITEGVPGIRVDNMAGQQAGCLHDYQLQSKDMKNVEQANVFVMNGAGMESFMDKVTAQLPSLRVVDASAGIPLFTDSTGEENAHVWVSISNCIRQVRNISEGLAAADPDYASAYRENAQRYIAELSALRGEMHTGLDGLPNRDIVTFHEAFPYFAEEFGLNIVQVVNREPDSSPSARELAQTIRLIQSAGVKAVFTEPQYDTSAADIVARESGAQVYKLDPVVTGPDSPDAYLDAMRANMDVLKEALQ